MKVLLGRSEVICVKDNKWRGGECQTATYSQSELVIDIEGCGELPSKTVALSWLPVGSFMILSMAFIAREVRATGWR